ncbi:MAG: hypothetical protein IKV32_04175 [Muribaculaceae bacterium]|nr:hypothetical protein [Muribaculaceae bacterium]
MVDFLNSTEFYVYATVVAAAIVALLARPSSRGEARQHLLAGDLSNNSNCQWGSVNIAQPSISIQVRDDGAVVLTRHGLEGVSISGAVSLAITVIGFDITIEERIVPGNNIDDPIDTATFVLDFLAPDRYHLKYNSSATSRFTTTTLLVRPEFNKKITLTN